MSDTSKNSPNIELTDGIVQKTADDTICFMAWHGEALALMNGLGFVICKKTM